MYFHYKSMVDNDIFGKFFHTNNSYSSSDTKSKCYLLLAKEWTLNYGKLPIRLTWEHYCLAQFIKWPG